MSKQRDDKFRILCQVAFDGVVVHDAGRILEVNEKAAAIFGYTQETMLSLAVVDLLAEAERETARQRIRNEEQSLFEAVGLRADGTQFPMEVCAFNVPGKTIRVAAVRDLSSLDLICTHDLDGRLLSASAAAARALGAGVQALVGSNLRDYLHPEAAAEFNAYLERIERDGTASGTMVVRGAGGVRRTWEYHNTLRVDPSGRKIVRGIARDVTERADADRALRQREEQFRSIIENVSDFISILEPTGEIRYASPSVAAVIGRAAAEMTGTRFLDLVHPDDVAAASAFLDEQRNRSLANGKVSLRFRHAAGTWRSFEVLAKNLVNAHRVTAIVTTARDITDRLLLEKQLEQANRLTSLGRLAATVAHEFNNVLMGMLPFAELLQRQSISKEAVAKAAWHISSSVLRGKRIAQEILRFTRPSEPDIRPLDFARWWKSFGREMAAMTSNQIRFVADVPERLFILADAAQLSQVMSNIIGNARDAMPNGGTITVRVAQPPVKNTFSFGVVAHPETMTHISVEDSGSGIPHDVLHHVFDPLFTTKQNGTGLGLAIAHQMVTRQGGEIFAESQPGRGSTFHIFLPTTTAEATRPAPEPRASRSVVTRRVLIVDDEPYIVDGIAELLHASGIEVQSVGSGEEALGAVERFEPEIVVMDVGLPGIDGVEAYRRIRTRHAALPVVFSSGHGDRKNLGAQSDDRLTRFLQKPFAIEALLETIGDLERAAGVA